LFKNPAFFIFKQVVPSLLFHLTSCMISYILLH
jgi:hypothetical protein